MRIGEVRLTIVVDLTLMTYNGALTKVVFIMVGKSVKKKNILLASQLHSLVQCRSSINECYFSCIRSMKMESNITANLF